MRNILLVVRWPIGGIRTHLKYVYPLIYRELPELKVTMIAARTEHSETLERDLAALPITYVYLDVYCSFRTLVNTVRQQLAAGSFDLVHSQGFTAGAAAALPANLRRVPHLMSVHDVIQDSQFVGVRGWARKQGMKAVFGRVDLVHAVSGDVRENLIAHLGRRFARRVRVVRNGILTRPILAARPRDLRAELGLGSDTLLVGFFGRFMAQKGFLHRLRRVRIRLLCGKCRQVAGASAHPRRSLSGAAASFVKNRPRSSGQALGKHFRSSRSWRTSPEHSRPWTSLPCRPCGRRRRCCRWRRWSREFR